jgi:hypothetical protein
MLGRSVQKAGEPLRQKTDGNVAFLVAVSEGHS